MHVFKNRALAAKLARIYCVKEAVVVFTAHLVKDPLL